MQKPEESCKFENSLSDRAEFDSIKRNSGLPVCDLHLKRAKACQLAGLADGSCHEDEDEG